ncbi:uncharacterized protein LOC133890599 [Phragmites australis]|uniref:uncharacterized protein LOC133890599 n=1 Tax=Phragmites australis TaxID=29695 RepID=UPI002D76E775|nr:uncharacterized protein LOC133890599 [Phragmites australis]
MDGTTRASSFSSLGPCRGGSGTQMSLQWPQLLSCLQGAKVVAADDQDLAGSVAVVKTGKRRSPAQAVKVFVSGLVEMVGRRFECSIPAARRPFGGGGGFLIGVDLAVASGLRRAEGRSDGDVTGRGQQRTTGGQCQGRGKQRQPDGAGLVRW